MDDRTVHVHDGGSSSSTIRPRGLARRRTFAVALAALALAVVRDDSAEAQTGREGVCQGQNCCLGGAPICPIPPPPGPPGTPAPPPPTSVQFIPDSDSPGLNLTALFTPDPRARRNPPRTTGRGLGIVPLPACVVPCQPPKNPNLKTESETSVRRDPRSGDGLQAAIAANLDPANVANGEFYVDEQDLTLPGLGVPFIHRRFYRSRVRHDGPLGKNWDHGLNQKLTPNPVPGCDDAVLFHTGEATTILFRPSGGFSPLFRTYEPPTGIRLTLRKNLIGSWQMVAHDGTTRSFDSNGLLVRIADPNDVGLAVRWERDPASGAWRVANVRDSEDRTIVYTYTNGFLASVRDQGSGLQAVYGYDGNHLDSATNAAGRMESYKYWPPADRPAQTPPADPEGLVPESFLRSACELACAPAGSQCGAGGGCPAGTTDAAIRAWCAESETRCLADCRQSCSAQCTEGCTSECLTEGCGRVCAGSFTESCNRDATAVCTQGCNETAQELCRSACTRRTEGADFLDDFCFSNCHACVLRGDRCGTCIPNPIPQCTGGSCNDGESCVDLCRTRLLNGDGTSRCGGASAGDHVTCAGRQERNCIRLCEANPAGYCAQSCAAPEFLARCRPQCESGCAGPDACGRFRTRCADEALGCASTCVQRCVQAKHAAAAPRYGYHEDLAHNLIEIFRGDHKIPGNLPYLRNVYGEDPALPKFDALVRQENRGHAQPITIDYHFKGVDPAVEYPAGTIDAYQAVTICPALAGAAPTTPPGPAQRGQGPKPVAQTTLVDPYGVGWIFFIDDRGQILRTLNAGTGAVRSFNYDDAGRLIGVEQPLGDRVCLAYDADGNMVRRFSMPVPGAPVLFDHIRQELTYQKFPNGMFRLQTVADPRSPTRTLVRYGWDQFGNPLTVMDAEGFVTSFTAGRGGVPVQEVRPDVSIVRYDYQAGALSRTVVDFAGPAPVVTSLAPDSAGRPRLGTGPFGEQTEWIWEPGLDRLAQIIRRNDDKTETITHKYDALGQLQETSNGKRRTVIHYDEQGLLRRVSDFAMDGTVPPLDVRDMVDPDPLQPRPDLGPRPGQVTCTRFGPSGRYLETVLPDGSRMRFQYDGEGRVTAVEAGALASDGSGWDRDCPRFTGPFSAAGILSSTQYDLNGRPEVIRDGRGQATRLTYDGFGNPATVTDAGGTVTRQGFDQMGNVVWSANYGPGRAPADYRRPAEADPGLLAAVELDYDAVGRLKTQRRWHLDKDGRRLGGDGRQTTTVFYDTARRRRLVTDDKGATTIFEWDGAGRPRRTEHPTGGVETAEYSRNGLSVLRTSTAPTERGRIAELLRLTSWGAPSRLISNVPLDRRPPETADDVNALLNEVQAGGLRTVLSHAWAYDEHKRLELTRNVAGLVTTLRHDALDRQKTVTTEFDANRAPEVVNFLWDRNGQVGARTSAIGTGPGATTLYQYDALGRLRQLDRPEGVTEKRQYEGASPLLSQIIDGRGVLVRHRYTPTGLLEVASALNSADQLPTLPPVPDKPRDPMDGTTLFDECGARRGSSCEVRRFFRDALGRTTRATAQVVRSQAADKPAVVDRVITSLDWDSLGNRTREVNDLVEDTHAVTHVHDNLGRPEVTTFGGQVFRRQFDALGRLKALRQGDDAAPTVTFDYAPLGAPTRRTLRTGITTSYTYDVLARLRRIQDVSDRPLATWRWELPADGVPRLAGFKQGNAAEVSSAFEVDRAGRLQREWRALTGIDLTLSPTAARGPANTQTNTAAARVPSTDVRTYTLDARHNWTQLDATDAALDATPELNQLDAYTTFRGEAATYNGDGSLASLGASESYSYNLFGDPVAVTKNGTTRRYLYDAFSRVVQETDAQASPASRVVHNWDGPRRAITRRPGSITQIAVDGDGLDEHLLLVYRGPTGTTFPPGCAGRDCALGGTAPGTVVQPTLPGAPATITTTFFFHQERGGSVYMITDARGTPVELYDYTAYGETRIRTPEGGARETSRIANPFGFQGHLFDSHTGLAHMRSRFYRPEWGRFTSPDPIGLAGGSNLYAFVDSAPLKYIDPFGLSPVQSNVAQQLTSNFYQQTNVRFRNQAFGSGSSFGQRVSGFLGYVQTAIPAAAESASNLPGAFAGNVVDQTRLRGAADQAFAQGNGDLGQQLLNQADRQANVAGQQIADGLFNAGTGVATGTVITRVTAAGTLVTVDAAAGTGAATEGARQALVDTLRARALALISQGKSIQAGVKELNEVGATQREAVKALMQIVENAGKKLVEATVRGQSGSVGLAGVQFVPGGLTKVVVISAEGVSTYGSAMTHMAGKLLELSKFVPHP